jgi:hypothetical protein
MAHGGGGNTGKWIGAKGTFLEGGIRVPPLSAGLPNYRKASLEIRSLRSWTGIQACWNGVELKSQMLS